MKNIILPSACVFFLTISFFSCTDEVNKPLPKLITTDITGITATSALSGGNITDDGGASVIERGVCWSVNPSPTIKDDKTSDGTGGGTFVSSISGLTPNTDYFLRAYATNSNGTAYGLSYSFMTKDGAIIITTTNVSDITLVSAKSGGAITDDGGSEIISRGVCWSENPSPTISNSKTTDGEGVGTFESSLTALNSSTTFYLRAYATNSIGTFYGDQKTFSTLTPLFSEGAGVTDIDGNTYNTIILGTQEWMAQNLKTTKYANGETITNAIDNGAWGGATSGAWSYYNNDIQFNDPYGKLYNWLAVEDSRKICPTGYHVPSDSEWSTLESYLGGNGVAGGKLKEIGIDHWLSPNTGATNASGFNALPGGDRAGNSPFEVMGSLGRYWTATGDGTSATAIALTYDGEYVGRNGLPVKYGLSIRCVKD